MCSLFSVSSAETHVQQTGLSQVKFESFPWLVNVGDTIPAWGLVN